MVKDYRVCSFCVMDESDPLIRFDEEGRCNHCQELIKQLADQPTLEKRKASLFQLADTIKKKGLKNQYDCIIGLSGGVDSSYLAYYITKELDLKPLAVHLDNGWNSELAVKNIENITQKLDIDLFTHVVDWEEFKAIQLSYIRASVIDIEVVTDQAIRNTLIKQALKFNIPFILSGNNLRTEGILPNSWIFNKSDQVNLKDIYTTYGSGKFETYPRLSDWEMVKVRKMNKVNRINILDYIEFNKDEAKGLIISKLEWKDYGGKHYESIFTRFYQGYILPKKFDVDKRKAHLSSLIASGQITRNEALEELNTPPYPDPELERSDYEFVLKKLELSKKEFEEIMKAEAVPHSAFARDKGLIEKYLRIKR